jgi:hypothetical protein
MKTFTEWMPYLFPIFFVGMWLFVGMILSHVSGWASLAERYAATGRPTGRRLWGQVVSIGSVNENGVTGMIVTPQGLYLSANPLFRFGRRSLLIPWQAVSYVSERKIFWWHSFKLDLGGITTIRVKEAAMREIKLHIREKLLGEVR